MTNTRAQINRFGEETIKALELENIYDTISSLSSLCGEKNQSLIDTLVSKIMRLRDSETDLMVMIDELNEQYEVRGRMLKKHGVDVHAETMDCDCSICDKK